MNCPQCQVEVNPESVFCHQCGARLAGEAAAPFGAQPPAGQPAFDPNVSGPAAQLRSARGRRDAPEEELWQGGYSPKAMIGMWILAGLLTIAAIVAGVMFAVWPFTLGAALLVWIFAALQLVYRQWSVKYRLTSQRFFHESGLLRRTTDRIEVIDMDDITCVQGPIERMVGVGTIKITSSDRTHPEFRIPGIDQAPQVAILMDDARRAERMRRGIHIESV